MPTCTIETLSLSHQSCLQALWKPLCLEHDLHYSEYSFPNDYLFRQIHHYEFVVCHAPLVRGRFNDGSYYLIPTMAPKQFLKHMNAFLKDNPYYIYPIPDQWVQLFQDLGMEVTESRDDADYLYHTEKLQTLAGRDLSSRRNLLHQLESNYALTSKPLTKDLVPIALEVLEKWQAHTQQAPEKTDYFSCKEALKCMEKLQLIGRIGFADNQPIGFTIGEYLTPKTVLLHMEKSLHEFKGATPYLFQDFARHLKEGVEWINFEQDLGIPALRQAKTAYRPDMLLKKWRAHY